MAQAMRDPESGNEAPRPVMVDIRRLTAMQLRTLGLAQVAYLAATRSANGAVEYVIHGADGDAVAVADELDEAFELIDRMGVMLVPVH